MTHPTPTDLAAAELKAALGRFHYRASYDDPQYAAPGLDPDYDAYTVAREYLRLLPAILAVREARTAFDAAMSQPDSFDSAEAATARAAYKTAAYNLAAVCATGTAGKGEG